MVYLLEPPVYRNPGHRACSTGCMCRSGYGITAPVPDGPVWGGAAVSSAPTASVARGRWERRRSRRLSPRWQPRRMWPRPPGTRHCRRCCFLNGWCWGVELPQMGEVVRGRRLRRLPVVLSQEEVARLPQALPERERELMARLRYRTGMCLLERQRLRIKCVDFVSREISGHSDKGGRDRCVPLPESLRGRLLRQRGRSLVLQGQDPAGGNGRVHLPHASARKYPGADGGPGWPYLFPFWRVSVGPRSGRAGRHPVAGETRGGPSKVAHARACIAKPATHCALRYPFATHLLGPPTVSARCRRCPALGKWRPSRSTRTCWAVAPAVCRFRWTDCRAP